MWGHHITEAPINPEHQKRFLAVPVKSSTDANRTIGVLRYACPSSGKELTVADLVLFYEITALISAVIGLNAGLTRVFRGTHIAQEKDGLRRTYDFEAFLAFAVRSLRSPVRCISTFAV